ncbi:MAG: hypothetical protein U0414_27725 [Polyangiaceae bacterium]
MTSNVTSVEDDSSADPGAVALPGPTVSPAEWVDLSRAPTHWIGPSSRRVMASHLVSRVPLVSSLAAFTVVLRDRGRATAVFEWLGRFTRADSAWAIGFALLPFWVCVAAAHGAFGALAGWLAFLGQHPYEPRILGEPFGIVMFDSPRRLVPRALWVWTGLSFLLPVFPPVLLLVLSTAWLLPAALGLWSLIDGLVWISHLRVAKLTPHESVSLEAVEPQRVSQIRARFARRKMTGWASMYWDPFGGLPRGVAALMASASGIRVLEDAGLLPVAAEAGSQ